MAYKEVEVDDALSSGGRYVKFEAIGDTHVGVYLRKRTRPAHGDFKESIEYTFKDKTGEFMLTPPVSLAKRLEKADQDGELKPNLTICKMRFDSTIPTAKGNPMKIIKLGIDNETRAAAFAQRSAPKPAPQRDPGEDDVPF